MYLVIDPLFMNNLNEEFEEIKDIKVEGTRNRRLRNFEDKLASLKLLDMIMQKLIQFNYPKS